MASIIRLPEAVHRRLRSGAVINDMARIVEELVYNSLDSGATKIDVAVSIASCCIKVADDGSGISRDGLMLLGEQHVTIRDIFYNQQVRRKHMESSYYKMLNAIKMTVLRIALVHLNVSFKVVDRDSMNKLLHTQPSTSPSVMLSRNFGVENPASFFELNLSDGALKLSGFVSAPWDILSVKAIQFIQKGPIHKLLNQLAGKFNLLGSSQLQTNNEELIKHDSCSTFILNLSCPRSHYDVFTDEQSKTIVEFKDWTPVLAFIENSVMHLWIDKASGIRLKSRNTENFHKTLELHSPRRKKLCRSSDVVNMKKSTKLSDIKKSQRLEALLHDVNFALSPVTMGKEIGKGEFSYSSFSPTFASCAHYEKGLSAASVRSVLTDFETEVDEKPPFGAAEVSVSCPKVSDDIDFCGYPSKSFMRSCSSGYESFELEAEGFDVEQWTNRRDAIMTETELMFSGKDLWYDGARTFQPSLGNKYNEVEASEAFMVDTPRVPLRSDSEISGCKYLAVDDASCSSFSKENTGFRDEFSFEMAIENFRSSNLSTRDEWQHHDRTTFPYDRRKFDQSPRGIGRPVQRFFGTERTSLISPGEETPKKSSIETLFDTALTVHEYAELCHGNQYLVDRRKERPRRSSSAPPFHKGKKRYLDLAYSSTLSAISDFKSGKLQHQQQSLNGEAKVSPRETSARQPVKSNMLAGVGFKEGGDGVDALCKWDSSLPVQEAVKIRSGDQKPIDSILDVSSDILRCDVDGIVPTSIDRESLQDARVLSQLDKKFIAVVARTTLALIDQHAADERIRLEELRHKVLSGEMRGVEHLDAEQELVLPEIGYQLLHNYAEQIQAWGWTFNIQDTSPFTTNLNFFQKRPNEVKLLSVPSVLDVKLTDIDLLEFLQQLADTDGSSTVPPSILRILNNKSCRGAIMFGDSLLPSECSLIVEELKQTSLCFQCAHGRPTTVPIIDLELLRRSINKLTSSDDPWHGLCTHEISLHRTKQRLIQARSSVH